MNVKAKTDFIINHVEIKAGDIGEGFWVDGRFCARMPNGNISIGHDDFF